MSQLSASLSLSQRAPSVLVALERELVLVLVLAVALAVASALRQAACCFMSFAIDVNTTAKCEMSDTVAALSCDAVAAELAPEPAETVADPTVAGVVAVPAAAAAPAWGCPAAGAGATGDPTGCMRKGCAQIDQEEKNAKFVCG